MDQRRDVLASEGWRDAISDLQAERAQLRHHIDELRKTIDRLHALRPEYHKLIKTTRQSILDAYVPESEINTFAMGLELSPIPGQNIK